MYKIDSDRDQQVINSLNQHFGEAIAAHEISADMLNITINKSAIHEVLSFLKNDKQLNYNFLTTLCGMHYPENDTLGVVYHLHSFEYNHRIRVKTTTELADPVIPTISDIWPAANWQERETYDFYGIRFQGHPNLKRILNVDEMTDFPLRKDFPLEDQTRDDKNDSMFGR